MVFYGSLILLLPIFVENKQLRWFLQGLLGLIILSIGMSRIYLGVHYPSDVVAGGVIGSFFAIAVHIFRG